MRGQSLGAAGLLLVAGVGLYAFAVPAQPPAKEEPKVEAKPVVLPGLRRDGFVQLPNQWSLKPAGRHIEVGDLPINIAIHPTGEFAALAVGPRAGCALDRDGSLRCWPMAALEGVSLPPDSLLSETFTAVAIGNELGCAIKSDGALVGLVTMENVGELLMVLSATAARPALDAGR